LFAASTADTQWREKMEIFKNDQSIGALEGCSAYDGGGVGGGARGLFWEIDGIPRGYGKNSSHEFLFFAFGWQAEAPAPLKTAWGTGSLTVAVR
jgi:hypothetical protein